MTAPIGLEVGTTSESCAYLHEKFAGTRLRNGNIFITNITRLIKYEGFHYSPPTASFSIAFCP
jgi:hypothetical protein